MKNLLSSFIIILTVLTASTCLAQSISFFDVDTTNFPTMKAKFYALDKDGRKVTPNISDLKLTENGINRTITNVSCPITKTSVAISSVLVIDVSGSMSGRNLELAKIASSSWVNGLPLGNSECAITSFDNYNYLNQDFTTNRTKLLKAILKLTPNGGTNYDAALLDPMAGGLQVSRNGKYKKVTVFLSDGMPNIEPKSSQIIAEAKAQNCVIFCVSLGMPAPQCMKDIAGQTGGNYFENVTTTEQAEQIYNSILQQVIGGEPCNLEWISDVTCSIDKTIVEFTCKGLNSTSAYKPPTYSIASLKLDPNFINFANRIPSTQNDTTITLTAQNTDFTVTGIYRKYGSPDFNIVNTNFPITIPKNTTKNITLRFSPSDSSIKYVSFEIETDKCPAYFSVYGGFPGKKSTASILKLTKPNGGESFLAGSDTIIAWQGITPLDKVKISFSNDSGNTWIKVNNAKNLNYNWTNIPKPKSKKCLIQIEEFSYDNFSIDSLFSVGDKLHKGNVRIFVNEAQSDKIYTAGQDGTVRLWDSFSGEFLDSFNIVKDYINKIVINEKGNKLITFANSKGLYLWDLNTKKLIMAIDTIGRGGYFGDLKFAVNNDASIIVLSIGDKTIKVWDISKQNKLLINSFNNNSIIRDVLINKDGSKLFTYQTFMQNNQTINQISIRDLKTNNLLDSIDYSFNILSMALSLDEKYLYFISDDNKLSIWDIENSQYKTNIDLNLNIGLTKETFKIKVSNDGNKLCVFSFSKLTIIDLNDFSFLYTIIDKVESDDVDIINKTIFSFNDCNFTNDSKSLNILKRGRVINTIDLANNSLSKKMIVGSMEYIQDASIVKNNTEIAVIGDRGVCSFDYNNRDFISFIPIVFGPSPNSALLSPDGKKIAITNNTFLDISSGKFENIILENNEPIKCCVFTPDSKKLIFGNDGKIKVLETEKGKLINSFEKIGNISCITISKDGQKIITASLDGSFSPTNNSIIRIRDINSGKIIKELSGNFPLYKIIISKDMKKIIGCDLISNNSYYKNDTTIKIWDIESGILINTIKISKKIEKICTNMDGSLIFAVSSDSTIRIWDVETGKICYTFNKTKYKSYRSLDYDDENNILILANGFNKVEKWINSFIPIQSDTSDSVFSIVAPEARFNTLNIDLGKVVVNSTKDSTVTALVCNTGEAPLHILGANVTNGDISNFMVTRGAGDFMLAPNECRDFMFEFTPTKLGIVSAKITIKSTVGDFIDTINITGEGVAPQLEIVNSIIDFGKVDINTSKDTLQATTIKNIGATSINITKTMQAGPNDKDFYTLAGSAPFTLNPGETAKLDLRFLPTSIGRTSGRLQFEYNGVGSPATVQLFGTGLGGTALIELDSVAAYSGDAVEIPIKLTANSKLLKSGVNAIRLELAYNKTLLFPENIPNNYIDGDNRVLIFDSLPITGDPVQTLFTMKFIAALGNFETTDIVIKDFVPLGNDAEIDTKNGKFTLLGVCKEGDTRLLKGVAKTMFMSAKPNPAGETLEIEYANADDGIAEFKIYNVLGEVVLTKQLEKTQLGKAKIDLYNIPTGQYYATFSTESVLQNMIISVIK